MYKSILVPLDGSKRAEVILPHAEGLAQSFGAAIVLMQVVEPPKVTGYEGFDPVSYEKELVYLHEEAGNYIKGLEKTMSAKGLNVSARIVQGTVVSSILSIAEDIQADLVAMASHGRSGLARVFYGSVAAGVLQRIDRPLLLIRSRHED